MSSIFTPGFIRPTQYKSPQDVHWMELSDKSGHLGTDTQQNFWQLNRRTEAVPPNVRWALHSRKTDLTTYHPSLNAAKAAAKKESRGEK